jgi:hypothetical protein
MELWREHCSHLAPRAPVKGKLKVMGQVSVGAPMANAVSRSARSPGSTPSFFLRFLGNPGTILAVTTVVGAALRFHHLGAKNLWRMRGAAFGWRRFPGTHSAPTVPPELDCAEWFDPEKNYEPDWIQKKDEKFEGKRLVIDNHQFVHCEFVRFTFVYSGGPFGFFDCEIDGSTALVPTGSAWRTIRLFQTLRERHE